MLTEAKEKFKPHENPVIVSLMTVLSLALGFGLGRLSKIEAGRTPVKIEQTLTTSSTQKAQVLSSKPMVDSAGDNGGKLVASKNGKKYYLPWCGGADKIKPENLISFASAAEARDRGYTPAANCPGL